MEPCSHSTCENLADPRWFAYCRKCSKVRPTCDGHPPEADEIPEPHPWNAWIPECQDCVGDVSEVSEERNGATDEPE